MRSESRFIARFSSQPLYLGNRPVPGCSSGTTVEVARYGGKAAAISEGEDDIGSSTRVVFGIEREYCISMEPSAS